MPNHEEVFLNPRGLNRLMQAEVTIARKASTISPRLDATVFSFAPEAGESDEEFKSLLLAELSEMIRSEEDPSVPHMHDLKITESHVNWGASGDTIRLVLEVSEVVTPAIIGYYIERILTRLGSPDEDLLTREEAIEAATTRVVTAYDIERSALSRNGEEELRDGGWRIIFASKDEDIFKVEIDSRGVTYVSRTNG